MKRLKFIIIYPIIWVFSRLPFFILHRISDFAYFIIYYIFNYRKEVVFENLKHTFPEKSNKEIKLIRKKFFQHFTDIFIESIKSFTISEKELNKRYVYKNPDVLKTIEKSGKSVILMGSHYANWEWIINLCSNTNLKCVGVYKRLSNPLFDKIVKKNRARFGGHFITTNDTIKSIIRDKQNRTPALYGLLSDQSPMLHKTHHWSTFLNNKLPIHTGAEMLAKKHDFTVLHMSVNKTKRSHYTVDLDILTENPREFADYEITDEFIKRTEKQIREQPEFYFWTHKRFKHKDKAPQ
jgi:KDO2-lipid IV(A) lauroyltransferase